MVEGAERRASPPMYAAFVIDGGGDVLLVVPRAGEEERMRGREEERMRG